MLVLLRIKAKGKARIGVVDLFFSHLILHPFILIKECMISLSIPYYLSYLTFPIREHLSGFGNCFMHLWGIWLDLVSLLFDYFKWHPYALKSLMYYILQKPITSQGCLLYTYSIHISVILQFQSPLVLILHVWLAVLWV